MIRDDELYRQYLAGDVSAGDQLMLQCSDALTAYLDAFLHNAHDAEDLMLECFAVILVRKPNIREGNFRAYLFRMARNKANRLWRQRMKRNEFSLEGSPRTVPGVEFGEKGSPRTVPGVEFSCICSCATRRRRTACGRSAFCRGWGRCSPWEWRYSSCSGAKSSLTWPMPC